MSKRWICAAWWLLGCWPTLCGQEAPPKSGIAFEVVRIKRGVGLKLGAAQNSSVLIEAQAQVTNNYKKPVRAIVAIANGWNAKGEPIAINQSATPPRREMSTKLPYGMTSNAFALMWLGTPLEAGEKRELTVEIPVNLVAAVDGTRKATRLKLSSWRAYSDKTAATLAGDLHLDPFQRRQAAVGLEKLLKKRFRYLRDDGMWVLPKEDEIATASDQAPSPALVKRKAINTLLAQVVINNETDRDLTVLISGGGDVLKSKVGRNMIRSFDRLPGLYTLYVIAGRKPVGQSIERLEGGAQYVLSLGK